MGLLALSIPRTVFLSLFSMIAFCTCPKENLNLHDFGQGDYCNFLDI